MAFGRKYNQFAYEYMAKSIPYSIIQSLQKQPKKIEALLFGQLGLLEDELEDDFYRFLQETYLSLKMEFSLLPNAIPIHFFRMRPNNFPTIRISQLAQFLAYQVSIIEWLKLPLDS